MRRTLIIIIVLVVIGLIGGVTYAMFMRRQAVPSSTTMPDSAVTTTASLPIAPSAPLPSEGRIVVQGPGGSVSVRNFLSDSSVTRIGDTFMITTGEHYDIAYQRLLQQFLVSIYATSSADITPTLQAISDQLTAFLDVTQPELCRLKADISIPDSYAAAFSDGRFQDLSFPGCQ